MKCLTSNFSHRLTVLTLLIGFAAPAIAAFEADHLSATTEKGMDLWHVPGVAPSNPSSLWVRHLNV
jgi:hypothetical protein